MLFTSTLRLSRHSALVNWEPSCFQSACVQDLSCSVTWQEKDYKGSFKRACVNPGWTSCLTPFRALSQLPDAHTAWSHASWKQVWSCFQWNKVFLNTESTVSPNSVRLSCLCDRGQGPPPLPVWPQWWMNCCWLRGRAPWLDDFCSCSVIECPVLSFCNYRRKLLCAANTGVLFQARGGQSALYLRLFLF